MERMRSADRTVRAMTAREDLHADLRGWWRIVETSQWMPEGLDDLGPAMISITGYDDRLRIHCLLAYVNVNATKTGASFTWEGAWEYAPWPLLGRMFRVLRARGAGRT